MCKTNCFCCDLLYCFYRHFQICRLCDYNIVFRLKLYFYRISISNEFDLLNVRKTLSLSIYCFCALFNSECIEMTDFIMYLWTRLPLFWKRCKVDCDITLIFFFAPTESCSRFLSHHFEFTWFSSEFNTLYDNHRVKHKYFWNKFRFCWEKWVELLSLKRISQKNPKPHRKVNSSFYYCFSILFQFD